MDSTRVLSVVKLWILLLVLVLFGGTAWAAALNITLQDGITGVPIADGRIDAIARRADGSLTWEGWGLTDSQGKLTLELEALDAGQTVFLLTKNPGGLGYAYSSDITAGGDYVFAVGNLLVTLLSGIDGEPMAGTMVVLKQVQPDGSLRWHGWGKTDAAGTVRLHAAGLGQSTAGAPYSYVVQAPSPVDGRSKTSALITTPGKHTFTVGEVLTVTLRDWLDETIILPGTRIIAYRVRPDDILQWYRDGYTDKQGGLVLDLDGLSQDKVRYQLRAVKPYGTNDAYSPYIDDVGAVDFAVGNLKITLVNNPQEQEPVPNALVYLERRFSGGASKTVGHGDTGKTGMIRFHAQDLENRAAAPGPDIRTDIQADIPAAVEETGAVYVAKTKSPTDGNWVYSEPIRNSGAHVFILDEPMTDSVTVVLRNKLLNAPIPNCRLDVYEMLSGDGLRWLKTGETDARGKAVFHLDGIGNGRRYRFRATQPLNTGNVHSDPVSAPGTFPFDVGTTSLLLVDGDNNVPLPGQAVSVFEKPSTGGLTWVSYGITGKDGMLYFHLAGLNNGMAYVFGVYNQLGTGRYCFSPLIEKEGPVVFTIYRSGDCSLDLTPPTISIAQPEDGQEVSPAGFTVRGVADDDQQLEAVDLIVTDPVVGTTTVRATLVTTSRSSSGSPSWTAAVTRAMVTPNQRATLTARAVDHGANEATATRSVKVAEATVEPPRIDITSHGNGDTVPATGFTVAGTVAADGGLEQLRARLVDPVKGFTIDRALQVTGVAGKWALAVQESDITPGETVTVTLTATDMRGQTTTQELRLAVADVTVKPPQISITSHSNGDRVPATGFTVSGTASAGAGLKRLSATLVDPVEGRTNYPDLEVAAGGNWALEVEESKITAGETIAITLTATDTQDQTATRTLELVVAAVNSLQRHLIDRITFGATPALLGEVEEMGAAAFIDRQLDPDSIDDSAFEALISGVDEPGNKNQLKQYAMLHTIHSKRQLKEVMAQFWENHFSTDVDKDGNKVAYELAEHRAFRSKALGNFRELLGISAKSPAMIYYLDNIDNNKSDANENLARELLELHTMGVDGGYRGSDVEAAAEVLTGWHVRNDAFFFDADAHNTSAQRFLGEDIPEGGLEQGELLLNIVVAHRSTAEYICTKLAALFVDDHPPESLVNDCADIFQSALEAEDQMTRVVRGIVTSSEFASNSHRGKIKTPLEHAVGMIRNFEAKGDFSDLPNRLRPMGMDLFENRIPTGWSEYGSDWISSSLLLERIKFVNTISTRPIGRATYLEPVSFFTGLGIETAEGIVGYLLDLALANDATELDREIALEVLNYGESFDIAAPDADAKLRLLLGTVLSYPQYNFQ